MGGSCAGGGTDVQGWAMAAVRVGQGLEAVGHEQGCSCLRE